MATPSAILSVLVNADTAAATSKLTQFDRQLNAVSDEARKGIEARLGATVDPAGFNAYEARLARTAQIARDRAAFKAELGANFNNAGFNAYERAVDKAKREAAVGVDMQVKITDAMKRLSELQVRLGKVPDKISTKVEVDTGVATAKLDLLQRKIRDVERDIAKGGGGGGGIGGLLSAFGSAGVNPFGVPTGLAGAAVAGAPAIAGGIGALGAVAGSAGAAALGAGALGTAGLGVGAAGLGPILALSGGMKDAIKLSAQLDTAQNKLTAAQTLFGNSSKQAAAAQLAINKIIAGADPAVVKFAQSWSKFNETLSNAEQAVLPAFTKTLAPVLDMVTKLLPTITEMAKIDLGGIGKGLKPLLDTLRSTEVKNSLITLSQTFAKLAVPIGAIATNLLTAFLHVAVAAAPYLIQIANALERWSKSFADSLLPGAHLNALIGGLVSQLKSWWELAKSVASLMITIFSAGAGAGQTLVNLLTGVVRQFNAWLNTKSGQEAMKEFFRNSAVLVAVLFRALGPLIGALVKLTIDLIPTFTLLLRAMQPALDLIAHLVSTLADSLKSKLGQAIAATAALLLGGPIVMGLVALGLVIGHLKEIVQAFRDAWRATWDAIKIAFNRSLSFILGGLSSLLGAIKDVVDSANIKIPGLGHLFGDLGNSVSKHIGQAQDSIDAYRRTLDHTANKAKDDLNSIGDYHQTAADRVKNATRDMISHVQTGIVTVDSTLGKEMKKLGVTVQEVLTGAAGHPLQSKPAFAKAGGGLIQIGQPGDAGQDTVPLNVGGIPIAVGAGEQVAVFNRHQLPIVNEALAAVGGLQGLFASNTRPHYMASGGMVGNIGAMVAEANRVDAQHFPYVWGGGHSGFTGGPFDCSGAVSDILHAGGVLNAPRVSGDFMNYGLPGPGPVTLFANPTHVYMSIDGKYFGTSGSNPGGGAGWFPGAPRPGFAVRHVGGALNTIKAPGVKGTGALPAIARDALKAVASGANSVLGKAEATAFGGSFGGGDWGSSGPVARQIFDAFTALGYNKVAIAGIIGNAVQESGLGSTSPNIFQFTPPIPGSSGSVATQAQLVDARGGQTLRALMNAASSPADAASRFMNNFEKPLASAANLPHRVAAAEQAFGQGYATGGLVRTPFATGGEIASGSWKPIARPPKVAPLDQLAGYGTKLGTLETDIATKLSQYGSLSTRFGVIEQGAQFFNPDGSTNAAGIAQQVADDQELLAIAQAILGDYHAELPLVSTALTRFLGSRSGIGKQISVDTSQIASNKKKIAANKVKEGAIRTALFDLGKPTADEAGSLRRSIAAARAKFDPAIKRAEIAKASYHGKNKAVKARLEGVLLSARSAENAVVFPLRDALVAAQGKQATRKAAVKAKSFDLRRQLRALVADDVTLATADRGITSKIAGLKGILTGAGGAQGENAIISSLESVASKLGTVNWGKGGQFLGIDTSNQGAAFDEQTTIDQLMNTLAGLNAQPAAVNAAVTNPQTIAMLQQLLQQANLRAAVGATQFNILTGGSLTPGVPFGGSFAQGGIVPGPLGAPVGIIAHGGESVSPAGVNVRVIMEDHRTLVTVNGVEQAVEQVTRGAARRASRVLPGSTGR